MFIVKAIRPHDDFEATSYMGLQCDYYVVAPSIKNRESAPGAKPYVPPQQEISLYERSRTGAPDSQVGCLDVGLGDGQFCTVYVMNDRGKTIDTIQAVEHG